MNTDYAPNTLQLNIFTHLRTYKAHLAWCKKNRLPNNLAHSQAALNISKVIANYGAFFMAKPKRSTNDSYGFSWVRVALSEKEAEAFAAWYNVGAGDMYDLLAQMLIEGEKLTLSYSEKQDTFYATVMGSDRSHRNVGKGYSSFAKNLEQAIALAVWKYHHVLNGNMDEGASDTSPEFG